MKKIIKIGILGVMLTAASLQAQVNIYITGSTAFRANAFRAITNLYGANLQNMNSGTNSPSGSRDQITFGGTMPSLFPGQQVNIYCSYSGSAAGVQALVQNLNLNFFNSPTNGATNLISGPADLAFSDVFQAATPYQSPSLRDALVCIQPFAYVRSVSTPTSVTNITIQQVQTFLANGVVPLSYFTGKDSDDATSVYLPGRSADSGTRFTAEYDSFFAPRLEQPWQPDVSGNWTPFAGYASGSGVANALKQANAGPAIGYLGLADASSVNSGLNMITYNGNMPIVGPLQTGNTLATGTNDFTPIIKGQYSYWSYEHLFERTSVAIGSNVDKLRTQIINSMDADIANIFPKYALRLSEMKVQRDADGSAIYP